MFQGDGMKKTIILFAFLSVRFAGVYAQDTLIIQENTLGICTYDGVIVTTHAPTTDGWTGTGYIDANNGVGVSASWEIIVPIDSTYIFTWRYSFGGSSTNLRDGRLVIDGNTVIDTVHFPYTGAWSSWALVAPLSIHLIAGDHKIRLEATLPGGLANLDYFAVVGNRPAATTCTPQYVMSVKSNDSTRGKVSYSPLKTYYDKGTLVTMQAHANPGSFFQSWLGEETSADTSFTFPIMHNVNATARFLPNGTVMDPDVVGYATIQDDRGTPYLLTGGKLGDTVSASTVAELQSYLGSTLPYVVKFSGYLTGTEQISIKSDKTLLGVAGIAHLEGIGLSINQARNVIIRNISIAHVCTTGIANGDGIEINGASKNILIDHCEISSDRNHGVDYYDGALDIKNGSTFITIAWSAFHDHYKVSLISSGETQYGDTVIRATYHHNYFYNCGSRLPSIRFGKAHIYNNYYYNSDDAINSRDGAWVRVERNYFDGVGTAVMTSYSDSVGKVQLIDNHFGSSSYVTSPTCDLQVPYAYTRILDPTDSIPKIIARNVRTGVENSKGTLPLKFHMNQNYPNPFNPSTKISYQLPAPAHVFLKVYDMLGRERAKLVDEQKSAGSFEVQWMAEDLPTGVYFCRLTAGNLVAARKLLLIK
jgi:pectate lyase